MNLVAYKKELRSLKDDGFDFVIGIDEAGRGPLAGPVVAAAFCYVAACRERSQEPIERSKFCKLIADSKVIKENDREVLYDSIKEEESKEDYLSAYAISEAEEIDRMNILAATLKCMAQAASKVINTLSELTSIKTNELKVKLLVDGNQYPPSPSNCPLAKIETVVKGDATVLSIASASIIAKVVRDRIMRELDVMYPDYNLGHHKGYPTPDHKAVVHRLGPSRIHRLSFEPCYSLLKTKKFPIPDERDFGDVERLKDSQKKKLKRKSELIKPDPKQRKLFVC